MLYRGRRMRTDPGEGREETIREKSGGTKKVRKLEARVSGSARRPKPGNDGAIHRPV